MNKGELSTKAKRFRIIAHDICAIADDADAGDYAFLYSMLTGVGTSPALRWTVAEVKREWIEGDYAGPKKDAALKRSPHYEMVKDLWEAV